MKSREYFRSAVVVLLTSLFLPVAIFAEVIVLKSGKTIEGPIVEKTDKFIKIDIYGVKSPYYLDEIKTIDGVAPDKYKGSNLSAPASGKSPQKAETKGDNIQGYIDRGNALMKEKKFDQALTEFNKVIELNPKGEVGYFCRGRVYFRMNNSDKALSDFDQAIKINSNNKAAYGSRAWVYFLKKQYDKAWLDVHKAESLGYKFRPKFIERLSKASGRSK